MEEITLIPMDRELCHEFYRGFVNDPDIFMDMGKFYEFQYDPKWVDNYFDRQMIRERAVAGALQLLWELLNTPELDTVC